MDRIGSGDVIKLVASIVICQAAGLAGSFFTTPTIPTWYATLKKPSFTPPGWIIGIVWISLFLLMGIALFLVWRKGLTDKYVKTAMIIFGVQLVLNVLWSFLFFGLRSPIAGLVEIVILWIAILMTILYFCRISGTAGILLVPYILWVTFAAFLNFLLWRFNR